MGSNNKERIKIAIDGPAGAGKSTVAREVARRLKISYLDTGAMYRAVTLKIIRNSTDLRDLPDIEKLLNETVIKFDNKGRVYLDNEDVTEEIRSQEVNDLVSPVSAISIVRSSLVAMQQEIAGQSGSIIMEGRDIASRVMPDANYKFYLDASLEERARRRSKEQLAKGHAVEKEAVTEEIKKRDTIDSRRKDSPLAVSADAIVIDTTAMAFEEVVESIIATVIEGSSSKETG